jgi:hypothetical protein
LVAAGSTPAGDSVSARKLSRSDHPYRHSAPDQQVYQRTAEEPVALVINSIGHWWQPLVAADPTATGSPTRSA